MNETDLLKRITVNPKIFGGKPIIRGHRLAVEHVLGMLAAGDAVEDLLRAYPWLEREDVLACLAYARRVVGHERIEPAITDEAAGSSCLIAVSGPAQKRSFAAPATKWSGSGTGVSIRETTKSSLMQRKTAKCW